MRIAICALLLSATYVVVHTKKKIGTMAIGDLARGQLECNGKRMDPSKPLC